MDLDTFFAINFSPVVGMVFLFIFLCLNSRLDINIKRLFYILMAMELVELIVYNAELLLAQGAVFSRWRILLSAVGYSLRPALVFFMLQCAQRRHITFKKQLLAAVPLIINAAAAFSAFWTDAVYSYTDTNLFVRGPLGYTAHVCLFFYLIMFIYITLSQLRKREMLESIIMLAICVLLMGTTIIEAVWSVRSIGRTAIVLATLFYYMFFQTREYQATLDHEERAKNRLKRQASLDMLTGLLNKTAFLQELASALDMQGEAYIVLVFFDLDNFKGLNDTLGHQTGDEALKDAAGVMRRVFRSEDRLGRFGGDEFCVLLRVNSLDKLDAKLHELRDAIRKTYTNDTHTVNLTASIGAAAVAPGRHMDSTHVLEAADTAAYCVKKGGRDGYKIITL